MVPGFTPIFIYTQICVMKVCQPEAILPLSKRILLVGIGMITCPVM
jgi:hypothetical protein